MLLQLGQSLLACRCRAARHRQSPLNSLNLFNLVPHHPARPDRHLPYRIQPHQPVDRPAISSTPRVGDITGWIHSLTGGFGGTGSMSTTANGTTQGTAGQPDPACRRARSCRSPAWRNGPDWRARGNPIALGITGYQNGAATTQTIVATHNTTPPTTDWATLSGHLHGPGERGLAPHPACRRLHRHRRHRVVLQPVGHQDRGDAAEPDPPAPIPATFLPDDISQSVRRHPHQRQRHC